ncbi:hypothetical protein MKEN_00091100 [Mycena kentingensis (nom. inval.)]|nr:hypothetical protein MKEN_00091100 [Mycena kentingensis (nom. inval.)]
MSSRPPNLNLRHVPVDPDPPSPMFMVASRLLHWSHFSSKQQSLPLATVSHPSPPPPPPQSPQHQQSTYWPILSVALLLPLSTALVFFSLSTLPITMAWPRTLPDLARLGRELHGYAQSDATAVAHIVAVLAISAVWKHAWSIPGSVVWNVLAGALFSPAFATILMTALTTIGSAAATLLAMPLAPLVTRFFPRALDLTRHALEGDVDTKLHAPTIEPEPRRSRQSSAWVRLSVLRLVGVVPWSGINIACGVCGVSLWDCMLGTFIGCLPWTAVTCQIGDILQTVASHPSPTPQTVSSLLTSPAIIIKLVVLSFLSLAPILGREHLRALISHESSRDATMPDESLKRARWSVAWVHDWRTKIRINSRSRSREASEHELTTLVDEKRALEQHLAAAAAAAAAAS